MSRNTSLALSAFLEYFIFLLAEFQFVVQSPIDPALKRHAPALGVAFDAVDKLWIEPHGKRNFHVCKRKQVVGICQQVNNAGRMGKGLRREAAVALVKPHRSNGFLLAFDIFVRVIYQNCDQYP